jgi:uncharacterized phage-associated protein
MYVLQWEVLYTVLYYIYKIWGVLNVYSALDIASWFVFKTNSEIHQNQANTDDEYYEIYERLTHLKLQKLLYFAQGI